MIAEIRAEWNEIKNAEEKVHSRERKNLFGEDTTEYAIHRILADAEGYVYWTMEIIDDQELSERKDNDIVRLIILQTHGPYRTEASKRTAMSKLRKQMKEN